MNMIEIDWLPLGSIVLIKGMDNPVMIFGRMQKNKRTGQVFDYVGCLYPVGNLDSEHNVFFDSPAIDRLVFLGYQDEYEREYAAHLSELDVDKSIGQDRGEEGLK